MCILINYPVWISTGTITVTEILNGAGHTKAALCGLWSTQREMCLHVFLLNSCLLLKRLNVILGQQQSAEEVFNGWDTIFQAKSDWPGLVALVTKEMEEEIVLAGLSKLVLYRRETDISESGGDVLLKSDSWEANQKQCSDSANEDCGHSLHWLRFKTKFGIPN